MATARLRVRGPAPPLTSHVATEAVARAWQSRALVCAYVYRIGERMEAAPISTQAERERIYSVVCDEQGATTFAEGMPALEGM